MQTLIHPDVKLELTSFDNATCKSQVKSKNSKFGLDFRSDGFPDELIDNEKEEKGFEI